MTTAILAGVIVLLVGLLAYAGHRIEALMGTLAVARAMQSSDEHVVLVNAIWDKVRAQVLRDAADDWPRVDAEAERKKLSWVAVPKGDTESLVVRWLRLRADKIEGLVTDDDD